MEKKKKKKKMRRRRRRRRKRKGDNSSHNWTGYLSALAYLSSCTYDLVPNSVYQRSCIIMK